MLLILKWRLQEFGHLMQTDDSLEKSLMLGKTAGRRRRGRQRMRRLGGKSNAMNMNWGKLQEMVRDREAWRAAVHGVAKSQTRPDDWTTTSTSVYIGLSRGAVGKNPALNAGDTRDSGLNPASGSSPGEGNGNSLLHSCLENSMVRGAWWTMGSQGIGHSWVHTQCTYMLIPTPHLFPALSPLVTTFVRKHHADDCSPSSGRKDKDGQKESQIREGISVCLSSVRVCPVYACIARERWRRWGVRSWESPGVETYTSLLITLTQTCFRVCFLY